MKDKTKYVMLNSLLIGTLLLNLLIFTSRMRFFPWFIEDAWGYLGVFVTSPILLAIFLFLHHLQKKYSVTHLNKIIPLIAITVSLFVVFVNVTDFLNLFALIVNGIMLVVAVVVFSQHKFDK